MKLLPKLLSLLGALAIAGATAYAEDCEKECPGKKKDKEEPTLVAEGGCKKECPGKKKEAEGEEGEGTLIAGSCKDGCKDKKKEGEEGEGTLVAEGGCKDGCKKKKKEAEEEDEGAELVVA